MNEVTAISSDPYAVDPNSGYYSNNADFDILDFLDDALETDEKVEAQEPVEEEDEMPSLTLSITNVVAMANMRCHLRLKDIAKMSINVEYKALQNVCLPSILRPNES
ncbi:TATA box-binding protein-like protein 1 [Cichlidogyrus casuarinus]|uniref:TATA box-binding protein-like protein 1 n=1 Tax=Cichlidogyrus casuarinus TaxID=1844966 RepID=A0ABD2PRY9_9PLAT